MPYKLFRRQFLICETPVAIDASWKHRDLRDGWVLSYQEDLALREHREADGRGVLVLGNAYCLDAIGSGGSGHYAVLDWPHITTDGAATQSVFYGQEGAARVVSSNAGLAAAVLRGATPGGDPPGDPDFRHELRHPSQMSYVPAPGSRYRGVRRLLRDQRLNIATGTVERWPNPIRPLDSYQRAVDVTAAELTRFARELRDRTPGRVYLQLSAGIDTRTNLAAFHAAGVPFEAVTFHSPSKPERDIDITVARAISRQLGLRHHVIDMARPPDPAMREVYLRQTSGAIRGQDLTHLFPGDVYGFLESGDAMVGGHCYGMGRQSFREVYDGLDLGTATGAELWRRMAREPGPAEFVAFLDEWLAWRRQDPYEFNFVASIHLDQRLGAWVATLMSGYDLAAGTTIHPGNNAKILAALLTPDLEDQIDGRLQRDVIHALAPDLSRFPVNPEPLSRQIRDLTRKVRRSARKILAMR